MPRPTRTEILRYRTNRRRAAELREQLASLDREVNETEDRWLEWLEELGTDQANADGYRIAVSSGEPGQVNWEQAFRWAMGDAEADGLMHRVTQGRSPRIHISRERRQQKKAS